MKRFIAAGTLFLLASAGARMMAADELPKAETILDKAIEATGGKPAYQKIHSEVSSGSMEIRGMKGTMTIYRAAPDKTYTEMDLAGIGKIQEGSNGKIAWSNSAIQGPHLKEGEEKDAALLVGKFDADLNWRDQYPKVETAAAENVEGKDCYKVILTPKTGSPVTRYYDKQTNLLVKTVMTLKSPMGEVTVESLAGDYRKEGDILTAHKMTNRMMGQEFVISIDKIQYNAEIPASKFDLPDEIQALVSKDKK
jgi:zinc protease